MGLRQWIFGQDVKLVPGACKGSMKRGTLRVDCVWLSAQSRDRLSLHDKVPDEGWNAGIVWMAGARGQNEIPHQQLIEQNRVAS